MNRQRLIVFAVVLLFAASFSGCGGGNGYNPPPPPPHQTPTISISPTTATVTLRSVFTFQMVVGGTPTPTVACGIAGPGSLAVSGNALNYAAPTDTPASWSASISCTAKNEVGEDTQTAAVSLEYPKPQISFPEGLTPVTWCWAKCGTVYTVIASGVFSGVTQLDSDATLVGVTLQPDGSIQVALDFGLSDTKLNDPGFYEIWAANPSPGGGESNHLRIARLGNQNMLAVSPTRIYQMVRSIGKVYIYDYAGNKIGEFASSAPIVQIATDDRTGYVLESPHSGEYLSIFDSDGGYLGWVNNGNLILSIAGGGGYGCVSEPWPGPPWNGSIGTFDLMQGVSGQLPMVSTIVGGYPFALAIAKLGDEFSCLAYDAANPRLLGVTLPGAVLSMSLTLSDLTTLDDVAAKEGWGDWELAEANGVGALLHTYDKKLVLVNLSTGVEMHRLSLEGVAFRLAADPLHNAVVVATCDVVAGETHFLRVDVTAGTSTALAAEWNDLAAGLRISPDGTKLVVGARGGRLGMLENR